MKYKHAYVIESLKCEAKMIGREARGGQIKKVYHVKELTLNPLGSRELLMDFF